MVWYRGVWGFVFGRLLATLVLSCLFLSSVLFLVECCRYLSVSLGITVSACATEHGGAYVVWGSPSKRRRYQDEKQSICLLEKRKS